MNASDYFAELGMAWAEPEFSKQDVNAAAKVLVRAMNPGIASPVSMDDYWKALAVINNFRGSHAYPLNTFQVGLRKNCRRFDGEALVAQRIKRLYSIWHKLDRFPTMKLSQIQDIGGCRAILANVQDVVDVHQYYVKKSAIKHTLASVDDYVTDPKDSGYRGVHLVYRYFSDKKQKLAYNGLKIEIQLRSKYQHAWATAVETVGMFSGQALKSSLGSEEWKRFFALMGGALSFREGRPLVPGVPSNRRLLMSELRDYAHTLHVEDRLKGYRNAVQTLTKDPQGAHYFLLQLDPEGGTLRVTGFGVSQAQEAASKYSDAEQEVKQNPGTDAVLVSVESINALARAYPNYFADTRLFAELLNQALAGRSRGIRVSDAQIPLPLDS